MVPETLHYERAYRQVIEKDRKKEYLDLCRSKLSILRVLYISLIQFTRTSIVRKMFCTISVYSKLLLGEVNIYIGIKGNYSKPTG